MSLIPLTLENIAEFDQGSLDVMFQRAMRAIQLDLDDRPLLNKERKLTLEFAFKPDENEGNLNGVITKVKVKQSIPDKETRTNVLASSNKHGTVMFHPDVHRVDQGSLFGEDGELDE